MTNLEAERTKDASNFIMEENTIVEVNFRNKLYFKPKWNSKPQLFGAESKNEMKSWSNIVDFELLTSSPGKKKRSNFQLSQAPVSFGENHEKLRSAHEKRRRSKWDFSFPPFPFLICFFLLFLPMAQALPTVSPTTSSPLDTVVAASITILSLNVMGICNPNKRKEVAQYLSRKNADITASSETNLGTTRENPAIIHGYRSLFAPAIRKGKSNSFYCGIALAIKESIPVVRSECGQDLLSGRTIAAEVILPMENDSSIPVMVVAIYAPASSVDRPPFFEALLQFIRNLKNEHDNWVLLGDWNTNLDAIPPSSPLNLIVDELNLVTILISPGYDPIDNHGRLIPSNPLQELTAFSRTQVWRLVFDPQNRRQIFRITTQ
jgi:hypothetical protein